MQDLQGVVSAWREVRRALQAAVRAVAVVTGASLEEQNIRVLSLSIVDQRGDFQHRMSFRVF